MENLKAEKKEDKVWWNLNKSFYLDFASFAKNIQKILFSKAQNIYKQKRNQLL